MSTNNTNIDKINKIRNIINNNKTFLVSGHIRPDGDCIGSAFAMTSVLNRIGKIAYFYCNDNIPNSLKFLKSKFVKIKKTIKAIDMFDCTITLDSSNFFRIDPHNKIHIKQLGKIINIDHHSSHTDFGFINYVVPKMSSTAELVFGILNHMDIRLIKKEAESLYVGILTDTGCFKQINTTSNSHIDCAKLMKYNININNIYKKIFEDFTINTLKFHSIAILNMKIMLNNKISYTVITRNMLVQNKVKREAIKGIVNYAFKIPSIMISCLFEEISNKLTKVSCRSALGFNVLEIMNKFNGGGHKNAAGCIIKQEINVAIKMVILELKNKINL
ncbi:MAG: bifunctional oligoribonuclease/PAP phosphatase NrnA [Endomicrobium sp.]|jgi:phosphoesterase RecJ-like protein|nr:bifunctional oligoribonuclease/PAP phosphatase NrnA [Endomicrobium sp.]